MNPFDRLVGEALRDQHALAPLRVVVEKELLHHDILREMASIGVLRRLTFIGDTCLRACHGSPRLSEDLDFAGGHDFEREDLAQMGQHLANKLEAKYGLPVTVGEPTREHGNVDTWKLRMTTRPERRDLPAQHINIDICAIPSHAPRPMLLRNPYGVDMGTSGLIIQAEGREEILADKIVALALRPNRLKHRDLWDIGWLRQQNVQLPMRLIPAKIGDHGRSVQAFRPLLKTRAEQVANDDALRASFVRELRRFLPPRTVADVIEDVGYWEWLRSVVQQECEAVERALSALEEDPVQPGDKP